MNTSISPIITDNRNIQNQKKNKNFQSDIQTEQNTELKPSPNGKVWQAFCGISKNSQQQANKLINKFALSGKLGIHDISNLKKIIKQNSQQAENVSMLLSLVNTKDVNSKTLKYVCENGLMSDGMEKDIRMVFQAKQQGQNPEDAYIPNYSSSDEAIANSETGDLFEVEGQKNIYIKNKNGKAEQLKMDKKMMLKLFPPAERFANAQTHSADCYFVSTVNSMMDSPDARAYFLQCFEQDGDDIKITFPSNNFTYTAKNAEMPKTYKGNFVTGSTGMKLVEYAYGKFLDNRAQIKATYEQTKKIEEMQRQLSEITDKKEQKALSDRIKNYQQNLTRYTEDLKTKNPEYIVELDSDREPVMHDDDGISLKSLNQMNMYRKTSYQTAGDYYRGDGGFMEDVFKDFGFKETKAYSMDDEEIQYILSNPEFSKDYIFSGGTKREGKKSLLHSELIMDRSLNMYGAHAYRISPSQDEKGNIIYKVSNPWNSSHNSILTMEQLKKFFTEIHIAKIQ